MFNHVGELMNECWFKLYASGDAEGLYLIDENLPTQKHLYARRLRDLLFSAGAYCRSVAGDKSL